MKLFDVEITIVNENPSKGLEYRALFYDRVTECFYGGSGATALDALSWCMDEYIARAVHKLPHAMARPSDAEPGYRFGERAPTSGREAKLTPSVDTRIETAGPQFVDRPPTAAGCFDTQIPRRAQPTLVTDVPTKASSATRRAAAKKGKRQ